MLRDERARVEKLLLFKVLQVLQRPRPRLLLGGQTRVLRHPRQVRLERLDRVAHAHRHRPRRLQVLNHAVDQRRQRVRVFSVFGRLEIGDDQLEGVQQRDASRPPAGDGAVGVVRGESGHRGMDPPRGGGQHRDANLVVGPAAAASRVFVVARELPQVREVVHDLTGGAGLGLGRGRGGGPPLVLLELSRARHWVALAAAAVDDPEPGSGAGGVLLALLACVLLALGSSVRGGARLGRFRGSLRLLLRASLRLAHLRLLLLLVARLSLRRHRREVRSLARLLGGLSGGLGGLGGVLVLDGGWGRGSRRRVDGRRSVGGGGQDGGGSLGLLRHGGGSLGLLRRGLSLGLGSREAAHAHVVHDFGYLRRWGFRETRGRGQRVGAVGHRAGRDRGLGVLGCV